MKRTPTISIWIISFIVMIIFCETLNFVFWLSFIVFAIISVYIEKHSERLEREEE